MIVDAMVRNDRPRRRAVVLLTGNARAEEARKGLPPRFLQMLHRNLEASIRAAEDADLILASDTRDGFRVEIAGERRETRCEDLGQRLQASLDAARDWGYESVLLVAGDVADLGRESIEHALDMLATTDCVFAPSGDGGFSLVGLHVDAHVDWKRIPWFTSDAADGLRRELSRCSLRSIELPRVDDIDDRTTARRIALRPHVASRLRSSILGLLDRQPDLWQPDVRPHPVLIAANPLRAPPIP